MGVTKFYDNTLYFEIEGFNRYNNICHLFLQELDGIKNIFNDLSKLLNIPDEKSIGQNKFMVKM